MMKISPLILFSLLSLPAIAESHTQEGQKKEGNQPLKITANVLECHEKTNQCVATGKALVEKQNDLDQKTLAADYIDIFFEKKGGESPSQETQIKDLHAKTNVIITIKGNIIRGERAIYTPQTEIAEIYDNVSVTSGKNEILGNYGYVNMKTGEYKVLNKTGRVTALIFQKNGEITPKNSDKKQ